MDEDAAVPDRRQEAVRAGVRCGLFMAAMSLSQLVGAEGTAQRVTGAVAWGAMGFLAGFCAVWLGGVYRNARGGWNVTATFAALVLGTPLVALAGAFAAEALGLPHALVANTAAALWIGGLLVVRIARRSRLRRPHP